MTPVAKWLCHYDTGINDVSDWPGQSLASAALSEFAPAQTFRASSFVSAPFILRAPIFLKEGMGEMRRGIRHVGSPGRMETKDDNQGNWPRELTLGEPPLWRPPATRSKRSPSAERGEIFHAEALR